MEIFGDDTEFADIRMVQRVVDMFERRPRIQRIVKFGLLGIEYDDDLDVVGDDDDDDDDDDDYQLERWVRHSNIHGYPMLTGMNDRGLGVNHTRSPSSAFQHPMRFYTPAFERHLHSPSVKVQAKESDTERKARLLQETKKSKEKTEKKRLKKQKQKERRRLQRMEKEKQNPVKNVEGPDDQKQSKADQSKPVSAKSKDDTNSSVQESAQAKDTESSDSSEDESSERDSDKEDSGDSEELDLTSTFVSKAVLIARRKLEQKSRSEKKEKKKIPVKETKTPVNTQPVKPNEDHDKKQISSATSSSPAFEDNIKMSTDLAVIGNQFASSGEYNMAVKYFTDAIRYNPKEFKLFGNRSFCFEKMQEYEKALTDAELSLSMFPGWVKGLYRKGRALAGLKRYEEASQAFREVLKLDSACTEAAQELMRVQITQLMEYGFSREQSSNALIIHGTVNKALEVLSKLNQLPAAVQNGTYPTVQVANVTGTSPVLSANTNPPHHPPQSQEAPKIPLKNKPLGPVQNMSNVPSAPKPFSNKATKNNSEDKRPPPELFPVWVGNLFHPVTEALITNMFNKVGAVYSTKLLSSKRCAFVNFTKQEYCDEAIRRFNGFDLMGTKIAVRYPDRIPHGMGISKSALKAEDLQDENLRQKEYADGGTAGGSRRPIRPYRQVPDQRGPNKY